ncbi:chemotaxis protein CheW [Methyloparacoccus murrellii]
MLHLLFRLGQETFAVPAGDIQAVLPLAELESLALAPPAVAGLLRYQGRFVPVLDVGVIHSGTPAARVISTRIVLVRATEQETLLGLLVERAMEMLDLHDRQVLAPAFLGPGHEWLAPTLYDTELGLVRPIDWRALLTREIESLAVANDA